ncbi:MAG: DUF5063 domain-containing protein [Bacteroidetes bacterium]|nr:DUF5063 domain-containing protein [Bacteroidota bacterium]
MMLSEEPAVSRNVIEMITVANEYCLFLEGIEKYTKEDIISYFQKICPLMYLKGSTLPFVIVENPEINERFVTEENWLTIFNDVKAKMGKDDDFWMVDYNDDDYDNPVKTSVAEYLADIYQDMKDFLLLYQRNTKAARENAVSECRLLFERHWGFRAIEIHKIFHYLLYKEANSN